MHENSLLTLRQLSLLNLPVPMSYVGSQLFQPGTVNQIVGIDGVGKSFFSFDLACHIVPGAFFGPFPTRSTNVLFISEEMTIGELNERRKLLLSPADFQETADGLYVVAKSGLNLTWPAHRARLKDLMEESQAGVVFLDPISELHTAKENDHDSIRTMMKGLRDEIAGPLEAAVVIVHHMGKESEYRAGKERSRGTYNQTCSDILTLDEDKENDRVIVSFPKVRHGKKPDPLAFKIVSSEDGGRVTLEVSDAGITGIGSVGVGIGNILEAVRVNSGTISKKELVSFCRDRHGWKPSRTDSAVRAALDAQLIKRTKDGTQVIYVDSQKLSGDSVGELISFPHGSNTGRDL